MSNPFGRSKKSLTESTIFYLLFRIDMQRDQGEKDKQFAAFKRALKKISPQLKRQVKHWGTDHPLAHHTIGDLFELSVRGELEVYLDDLEHLTLTDLRACIEEWNRRLIAGEIPCEDFEEFEKVRVNDAHRWRGEYLTKRFGWENPVPTPPELND